jgi:bilin biosynthesis protein
MAGADDNAVIPDLDQLFGDLAHPNPYIQTQAFTAMAQHWKVEAMPRLIGLLSQPDVSLRRASVRALGAFGAMAMQPIADCFNLADDPTVRASCVKAYAQLASNYPGVPFSDSALNVLKQGLADVSPVVAVASVMALGQVGQQAVPLLLEISKGDNPAQGVAAVNALAEINDPAVEQGLEALMAVDNLDDYVRETLHSAILRVQDLKARQPA